MFVIGTAGHIDHGKSALVERITGTDPDRLSEEKQRGMTIDLGFAWFKLESGEEVSIIDVPGHEKFIKNMLTGVGGIDMAILVIAADEGIMPQTIEHFQIINLLEIKSLIVAITKKDLVDSDWISLIKEEISELLKESPFLDSPIIELSSVTGQGVDDLIIQIEKKAERINSNKTLSKPRLAIDRSFVISGFGSVVTGTLIEGSLDIGQEVELVKSNQIGRIRGLHIHNKPYDHAGPGNRVAVNISGISHQNILRGDTLTIPNWLTVTRAVDVQIKMVRNTKKILRHNSSVMFYTGASESMVKVRLLTSNELASGDEGLAQLVFEDMLPCVSGDRFIIRTSNVTIGGGVIIETGVNRHKRSDLSIIDRLYTLSEGKPEDVILQHLLDLEISNMDVLSSSTNFSIEEITPLINKLTQDKDIIILNSKYDDVSNSMITVTYYEEIKTLTLKYLEKYHVDFPYREGCTINELNQILKISDSYLPMIINQFIDDGLVKINNQLVSTTQFSITISDSDKKLIDEYLQIANSELFININSEFKNRELVNLMIQGNYFTKIDSEIVMSSQEYKMIVNKIIELMKNNQDVKVAEVRDYLNISRKNALLILEHLDEQKITKRNGDFRSLNIK
ncbi:MAG: selenocysteine-specific translation elongation factor [Dehalococcoidia bacterium]|nr:selenocysteine-specific translation elongation factor [Dehalococcoidia bacterium]|tara:strand:+ start:6161 stop:8029 length:1869 start_codon:yes stop_codon:yes gene_type:complete